MSKSAFRALQGGPCPPAPAPWPESRRGRILASGKCGQRAFRLSQPICLLFHPLPVASSTSEFLLQHHPESRADPSGIVFSRPQPSRLCLLLAQQIPSNPSHRCCHSCRGCSDQAWAQTTPPHINRYPTYRSGRSIRATPPTQLFKRKPDPTLPPWEKRTLPTQQTGAPSTPCNPYSRNAHCCHQTKQWRPPSRWASIPVAATGSRGR